MADPKNDRHAVHELVGELGSEKHVVQRIQAEMDSRGWSQAELSRQMDAHVKRTHHGNVLHQGVLSKLLRGDRGRHVSIDQLITLSSVFNVPLGELLVPDAVLANMRGWRYFMEASEIENQIREMRSRKHDLLTSVQRQISDAPELADRIREYRDSLIERLTEEIHEDAVRDVQHRRHLKGDKTPPTGSDIESEIWQYLRGVPAIVAANELLKEED